jgi:hypothetical protein
MPAHLLAACLLALGLTCSCAQSQTPEPPGQELVGDPHFTLGFKVQDPTPGKVVVTGALQPPSIKDPPVWSLAQWTSRHTIAGAEPKTLPSGAVEWSNAAKTIRIGPAGTEDADLTLAVNTSAEYLQIRTRKDPWVHLLVQQRFAQRPAVSALTSLWVRVSVRLRRSELTDAAGYNPRVHAAQFVLYLTAQNLNRASKGYGDFLYFGVPLYDNRHPEGTPRFMAPDQSGKFIFNLGSSEFLAKTPHSGDWVSVNRDVLPLILEGLKTAWERGFLLDSKDLSDYRIAGMNMGWEVPGPFDVTMQVRDFSVRADTHPAP